MNRILVIAIVAACFATTGLRAQEGKAAGKDESPGWEALSEMAEEASVARYSPEVLSRQIDKKSRYLKDLLEQRASLEAQLVNVIGVTQASLDEIEAIDDPVLRAESLMRFRSSKDVRMKTIRATLDAVNTSIARETDELAMLQKMLQARHAEARLFGDGTRRRGSYRQYMSERAEHIMASEKAVLERLRNDQVGRLRALVLPMVEPAVPDVASAVMNGPDR